MGILSSLRALAGCRTASQRPVPLSANKTVAQQMLAACLNKTELGKVGVHDPFEQACTPTIPQRLGQ
jgi:hypothetical protein